MAAVAVDAELRAHEDIGHRVRLPLDAPVGVEAVAVAAVVAAAVAVGGVAVLEVLAVAPAAAAGLAEAAGESAVQFQLVPFQVQTARHVLILLHAAATGVVGVGHDARLLLVEEAVEVAMTIISLVGAASCGEASEPPAPLVLLDFQVQDGLLLAVVDAGDPCQIALLVVCLDLIDHLGRDILQHQLLVAAEKLLAIDQYLFDLLAVVGDLAAVIDDDARQLLDEFLHHGTRRQREGSGVIDHRVIHHRHLRQFARDHSFLHQRGILLHEDVLHLFVATLALEGEGKSLRLEAHE